MVVNVIEIIKKINTQLKNLEFTKGDKPEPKVVKENENLPLSSCAGEKYSRPVVELKHPVTKEIKRFVVKDDFLNRCIIKIENIFYENERLKNQLSLKQIHFCTLAKQYEDKEKQIKELRQELFEIKKHKFLYWLISFFERKRKRRNKIES